VTEETPDEVESLDVVDIVLPHVEFRPLGIAGVIDLWPCAIVRSRLSSAEYDR
jgi:hypothetical protein